MKIGYCGLEKYEGRYTLQLQDWNETVFKKRGIEYILIDGDTLDDSKSIVTGQVLDAHGRSFFSLTQMANLVKQLKQGVFNKDDVIYFEDMFTPGIESLPYIFDQIDPNYRPRVAVRCLAQSIDPDDFVHVWKMEQWMATYERMVNEFADIVLASNEEMVAHMRIAGWQAPIYNISGLAFGKEEVQSRVKTISEFDKRKNRVCFASRWDREKNPNFYMDLIEAWYKAYPIADFKAADTIFPNEPVEFALFIGSKLRSNDSSYMARTRQLQESGKLVIYEDLKKDQYYELLADSRVLFNSASQDWTSNTVSEADALGTNVLFPAYRSFPEIFANDPDRMYIPWSIPDAIQKLEKLLVEPHQNVGKISDWTDGTIDRIIDILTGTGETWNRSNNNYRTRLLENKY